MIEVHIVTRLMGRREGQLDTCMLLYVETLIIPVPPPHLLCVGSQNRLLILHPKHSQSYNQHKIVAVKFSGLSLSMSVEVVYRSHV